MHEANGNRGAGGNVLARTALERREARK